MPLTGIQIFKLLPKTNCKECGEPTCLAFAMKLASGKAELAACPYVSEEAKAQLAEASAPPIRPITIGVGDRAFKIGSETVMFRHERRFENQPAFAMLISDTMDDTEIDNRLERLNKLEYERVGLILHPEAVVLKSDSGQADKFEALVNKVKGKSDASIILMSTEPDVLAAGLRVCADRKPLLYAATKENLERMADLAKESSCPVAVKASNLEELAELTDEMTAAGINDMVLDSGARNLRQAFEDQIIIRSAALTKKFRPLGFPTIIFPCEMTDNPMKEAVIASIFVAKYGGIIVLSDFQGQSLFPLLVERMNIYTSNFSLTYFLVSGEIETSKLPSYLLVMDTEGLSIMTAWAAGKFVADAIGPFVKKSGIEDKVKHRKLIIPGYAAAESGGLEEELPGWEVLVGPREASHIPAYLKSWKP